MLDYTQILGGKYNSFYESSWLHGRENLFLNITLLINIGLVILFFKINLIYNIRPLKNLNPYKFTHGL